MNKCLIVIDCQKDFITGALANKEAKTKLPAIISKINEARENKASIIYTKDTHDQNYLESFEGKNLPIIHCVENTEGWEFEEGINPLENEIIICKPNFGYSNWRNVIPTIDEIEVVGFVTDICVVSNALALRMFYPDAKITVDASCCAGVTPEKHKAALEVMKSCQIEVINE